jgi:hypothetical protein
MTKEQALVAANLELAGIEFIFPTDFLKAFLTNYFDELTIANSFIGLMPEDPDLCITYYDTGGGEQNDRIAIDDHKVMIRTRGQYAEARKLLAKTKLAIQSFERFVLVDGSILTGIWITNGVNFIGKDDQQRSLFSLNLRVAITPIQKGNRI